MSIGMLAFWALVIYGIVWLIRSGQNVQQRDERPPDTPEEILKRRLARGEISIDDYERLHEAIELIAGRTLDLPITAAMTVACVTGALVGGRLAGRLPQRQLATGFATLVAVVATYLLISAAFLGGPPGAS